MGKAVVYIVLISVAYLATAFAATFPCASSGFVDPYDSLPSGAQFPTSTLSSSLTPDPSDDNPLIEDHWSEVAKYGDYRPDRFTPPSQPERSNCPYQQSGLLNWHDPATWGGSVPGDNADVTIPTGKKVLISSCSIDPTFIFNSITVPAGTELIIGDAVIRLDTKAMNVAGKFLVGSPSCRLRNKVTITLYGSRGAQTLPAPSQVKGIAVTGQVDIHGMQYAPTWTRLAMTAQKGDTIIFVQDLVNWQSGQSIFITTTELKDSRDYTHNELKTIKKVYKTSLGDNVAAIELNSALAHNHYGGKEYQAEVGLISRNILIQGDSSNSEATATTASCVDSDGSTYPCDDQFLDGFGGHVQVIGTAASGRFSGVELYRMGQTNVLGRYPLHWHLVDVTDPATNYATDCSVYHSFYRCYTIHGTHGVKLSENTAYDAIGNCFYVTEAGVEENNTITYNLAAYVHPLGPIQNPSLGIGEDSFGSQTLGYYTENANLLIPADMSAAGFYITNMYSTFEGNAASGGWAGFSFPSLPAPIQEFKDIDDMSPQGRPFKTPFRGNTGHSSAFWWGSAGIFYVGGELKYTDDTKTTLHYTAGRSLSHDTCKDQTAGTPTGPGGCWGAATDPLWLQFEDNKAFLGNRGLQNWGNRADLQRFEMHDVVLSMNVFGAVWIDNLLMNCRSNNVPSWFAGCPAAPVVSQTPPWGLCNQRDFYFFRAMGGFQWYDVGQKHIMTDSTFRNCKAEWEHCIYGSAPGVCSNVAVFTSLSHSDQFVPQLMQTTRNINFENCGKRWRFATKITDPEGVTVSGRLQNWLDIDGSVTGLEERSIIGSARAGEWWNLFDCDSKDEAFYCKIGKKDSAASIVIHFDAVEEAKIGKTLCVNGNWDGDLPCPVVGTATHFGRAEPETSLEIALNLQITGAVLYESGGWFVRFTDGTPNDLILDNIQLGTQDTQLVLALPYPKDTTFDISFVAADWCGVWAVCTHNFTQVDSVRAVFDGYGDVYFWDNDARTLYLRPTMQPATFGDPGTDAPWTSIPPPPDKFTRDGITINTIDADPTIHIKASCATNPCAPQPDVDVPDYINYGYDGDGSDDGSAAAKISRSIIYM